MADSNGKRAKWNERYAGRELVWSAGPNDLLAREMLGVKPGTAFDAASGEGRNALWLAEQGWQVTAADFSEAGVNKARQIAARRGLEVNWLVADLARDPLPATRYDLVIIFYLHTDPAERALWLPRLVDTVATGGTFIYVGHDPANIEHGMGGPQDPELLPDADAVALALTGFEIINAGIEERPVSTDPGHAPEDGRNLSGTALDTFVRAVRR